MGEMKSDFKKKKNTQISNEMGEMEKKTNNIFERKWGRMATHLPAGSRSPKRWEDGLARTWLEGFFSLFAVARGRDWLLCGKERWGWRGD